eukprot:15245979-Alexandrium_andersonii.AAC.1
MCQKEGTVSQRQSGHVGGTPSLRATDLRAAVQAPPVMTASQCRVVKCRKRRKSAYNWAASDIVHCA